MSDQPAHVSDRDRTLAALASRPLIVGVFVLALVVAMVVAAIAGGVSWLIGVGGGGAALGTIGLALFTFSVAERTNELAESSQRLESATLDSLKAERQQAQAATDAAREARLSRVDGLAPLVDFQVDWASVDARPRAAPAEGWVEMRQIAQALAERSDFVARFSLTFRNYGRTPAFVKVLHSTLTIVGQPELIKVEPGGSAVRAAYLTYVDVTDGSPFSPREFRFVFDSRSALDGSPVDTIRWGGEVNPLHYMGNSYQPNPDPVKMIGYEVVREHEPEDARRVGGTAPGEAVWELSA